MSDRRDILTASRISEDIPVDDDGEQEGVFKMAQSATEKKLGSKISKNKPKHTSPHTTTRTAPPKDIFSSKKHSMDYVTVDGIVLRTGHADKKYWYLLCIKELLDNASDFLWKNYQGASDTAITVDITKTNDSMLHIKARNTNSKNIHTFENLAAIFDYGMRYGSKQNQRIISRGMLGDAMKQILSWPYVLIHTKDDGNSFTNKQWTQPLIIGNNGIERQIFLHVDKGNQVIDVEIKQEPIELPFTDTEIELTWPINDDDVNLDIHTIEEFCRQYPILTTDISFKFRLVDNSKHQLNTENIVINNNIEKQNLASEPKLISIVTFNLPVNDLHYCSFEAMYTWNCKASCYYNRKIYLI